MKAFNLLTNGAQKAFNLLNNRPQSAFKGMGNNPKTSFKEALNKGATNTRTIAAAVKSDATAATSGGRFKKTIKQ